MRIRPVEHLRMPAQTDEAKKRAAAVRAAWESRDWAGMVAAVSDEMIDTIAVIANERIERIRGDRLQRWSVYALSVLAFSLVSVLTVCTLAEPSTCVTAGISCRRSSLIW